MQEREPSNFLAGLPQTIELCGDERVALWEQLDHCLQRAARSWPAIAFERAALLTYLATKIGEVPDVPALLQRIAELPADDLLLGHACANGDSSAIQQFEARYFATVGPTLARMGLGALLDEVTQRVREQLFVARDGAPPRIAELAGNGDLTALVRVIATRTALNLRRRDARLDPDGDERVAQFIAREQCPETQALKAQQRAIFKSAFEAALGSLDDRDRSILRLHVLHRMSIDQIGELYDVHRATVARWLSQIREELGKQTRKVLRGQLQLGGTELASLVKVAESKIEISFDRLLRQSTQAE